MISKDFVLAGNAIFTVKMRNGEHFTYRVSRPTRDKFGRKLSEADIKDKPYFVGKLAGPDNLSDYRYLGIVSLDLKVNLTRNSRYAENSEAVINLRLALDAIRLGVEETKIEDILHCGHCGRCGRLLTVPESIESGIGPECAAKMGFGALSQSLGFDLNELINEAKK